MGHLILREDVGFKPYIQNDDGSKEYVEKVDKDVQSKESVDDTLRVSAKHSKKQKISKDAGSQKCKEA